MTGKIERLVRDKGFGFISSGGKDFFFHTSQCRTPFDTLNEKDNVEFDSEKSPKGMRAINVERI